MVKNENDEFEEKVLSQIRADIDQSELDKNTGARLFAIFSTKSWKIYVFTLVVLFAMTGVFIWTTIEFYNAETAEDLFFWGLHALISLFFCAFGEIWIWLEMNRVSVLRDLNRLSL